MRFITILIACVLLIGCQPGIIDELPIDPPRLVVQAEPEDGKPWEVYVSHTYATLDTLANYLHDPGPVPGASVKLFDNGQFVEDLTATGPSDVMQKYVSVNGPEHGHTYTLKVEAPGYNAITATYTHPSSVPLDNVIIEMTQAELINQYSNNQFVDYQFNMDIEFTDPGGDNYYELVLIRSTGPDPSTSENSYQGYLITRDPNDRNNSKTRGGTLIDDKAFAGQKVSLSFWTFTNAYILADTVYAPYVTIMLRTLSKEYYDFSTYLASPGPNSYDPYAQPSLVKTNIEGGFGVFAGYSKSNYTFELKKPGEP